MGIVVSIAERLQEQWQGRLDSWYPDGALVTVPERSGQRSPQVVLVPRIEVLRVEAAEPVIFMAGSQFLGPWRLVEHEILRTAPKMLVALYFCELEGPLIACAREGVSGAQV